MRIPEELLYTASHEWVQFLDEHTARIGITDYAQHKLGDIVYVNLPAAGDAAEAGEPFTDLESVKAVADIYSPVSGVIARVNEALDEAPELINQNPYAAWLAEIADVSAREELMDAGAYRAQCEREGA